MPEAYMCPKCKRSVIGGKQKKCPYCGHEDLKESMGD